MNNIKYYWDTFNFIDYLDIKNKEINRLPDDISISTMCASCKLNKKLDISNIENYIALNSSDILCVKVNNERLRTLIVNNIKPVRIKKVNSAKNKIINTNHFYNQVTVIIRVTHGDTDNLLLEPKINMKLFQNGSIQMSGCKNITSINIALNKLIFRLTEIKAKIENNIIIEKLFIHDNINDLTINSFKIDMINCNYKINIQINRAKLYNLLLKKKIKCIYEPCIRACVIIKYIPIDNNEEGKEISIFIFQKGNIIITGARSESHILSSYKYVNNIITIYKEDIIKTNEKEDEDIIMKIYDDIVKDINLGLLNLDI